MRDFERTSETYCSSSTGLSDSCLVQILFCFVEMLGGFLRALFVFLKVGDGDIGLLSCVEG